MTYLHREPPAACSRQAVLLLCYTVCMARHVLSKADSAKGGRNSRKTVREMKKAAEAVEHCEILSRDSVLRIISSIAQDPEHPERLRAAQAMLRHYDGQQEIKPVGLKVLRQSIGLD